MTNFVARDHENRIDGPGEHTGGVLVTPDGVRWTIGNCTGRFDGGYSGFAAYTYAVTSSASYTHDRDSKRRKVREDCEANLFADDNWMIDSFDGNWSVAAEKGDP